MKLAIMQPYFFPYIGYFQLIGAVDKFVVYDDVAFINKGWINRNNILVNAKATLFSLPLKNASQNRSINEIEISNETNWKNKLLKTIEFSYKKAPRFNQVFPLIADVIQSEKEYISQLALLSIQAVVNYLQLSTDFVCTSAVYNNTHLKAQQRILDICQKEKAEFYINPIGGKEIYSSELFEKSGIEIGFLKTIEHSYPQFANPFVPNLSIVDVLMFNSIDQAQQLLKEYTVI